MTALLEKVFKEVSALPEPMQDMVAESLIKELEWETQWNATLQNSQDALESLATAALAEHRAGKTQEGGFDDL